ncbi:MAG: HIT family protein [Prosthecobacter sp.]|uniref:HIT family protein n=1 Tax=Prosthecobacter sp. TaxID=1965333 RepID=UPI003BB03E17
MESCPFCRIAACETEAVRILEDSATVAFLDLNPVNSGHTLVIPRRHASSLTDLTGGEIAAVMKTAQRAAGVLRDTLPGCAGITLSLADGVGAGQEVPHVHVHVIPRFTGDQFGWRRYGMAADPAVLRSIGLQLREALTADPSEHP